MDFTAFLLKLFFIGAGFLGICFLIGFHEFGHFIFCKLFNVGTPTFSIGMGPQILKRKIGKTNFTLSAIPLGGYVEIAGVDGEKSTNTQESFLTKPYYQKMLVIGGGILFNLLFSYIVLSMLFFIGLPRSPLLFPLIDNTTIGVVEKDSPAYNSLKSDDRIIAVDDKTVINQPVELVKIIRDNPAKKLSFKIERNNERQTIPITIGEQKVNNRSFGYLGIDFQLPRYGFLQSIKKGVHGTHAIIWQVLLIFKNIFAQRNVENLGGPIMVISQTIKGAEKGLKIFLLLLAFISVNLAVLNILPIPIMDGGQALFYTIEATIGRPLPETIKLYIQYACWISILLLVLLLSYKDLMHIFSR